MRCDECGQLVDHLAALGDAVRAAFRAGAVSAVTSSAFVRRLAADGVRLREYRLAHNGSVNCTVSPEDELLVAHLEVPLQGVQRLDAVAELSVAPGVRHTLENIPFDPAAGVVLYMPKLTQVRQMPEHTMQVELQAVDAAGRRTLGSYRFRHRPWPGW